MERNATSVLSPCHCSRASGHQGQGSAGSKLCGAHLFAMATAYRSLPCDTKLWWLTDSCVIRSPVVNDHLFLGAVVGVFILLGHLAICLSSMHTAHLK